MANVADMTPGLNFRSARTHAKRHPGRRNRRGLNEASPMPGLILMTDPDRLPNAAAAIARLPAGSAVIFRNYDDPDRFTAARTLARLCRSRNILFWVAGDARLARACHADGLHLAEGAVRAGSRLWKLWRPQHGLVTAAAHSEQAIQRAARAGVDGVLLSPVFATPSHPDATPLGVIHFCQGVRMGRRLGISVYALGGMTAARARRLGQSGSAGMAGIGGIAEMARTLNLR